MTRNEKRDLVMVLIGICCIIMAMALLIADDFTKANKRIDELQKQNEELREEVDVLKMNQEIMKGEVDALRLRQESMKEYVNTFTKELGFGEIIDHPENLP